RLYHIDMRLRPTGRSGILVTPLAEFRRYYEGGGAQFWERQTLTRARVVYGDAEFGAEVLRTAAECVCGPAWRPERIGALRDTRHRLESSRSERDLKRGFGGLVDVEFLVQALQLKYCRERPAIRKSNTWEALDALKEAGLLSADEHAALRGSYDFLRRVQS